MEEVELASTADAVTVTTVPVGRFIDAAPPVREEAGVTIVPIVEERAVVVMRLYLREELHIRRETTHSSEVCGVTLRSEHATIERLTSEGEITHE